jgi:hypothetical protein
MAQSLVFLYLLKRFWVQVADGYFEQSIEVQEDVHVVKNPSKRNRYRLSLSNLIHSWTRTDSGILLRRWQYLSLPDCRTPLRSRSTVTVVQVKVQQLTAVIVPFVAVPSESHR